MSEAVKMKEAFDFFELEEVDGDDFEELYEMMEEIEEDPEKIVQVVPESKLAARSWAVAYSHLDSQNKWLKDYQKELENRYIKPVKDEMEKNERAQMFIKRAMFQFLENAEEKSVKFPDVGTFSNYDPADSIVYPEEEEEYARRIYETGTEEEKCFIRVKYSFDKNAIKSESKDSGELPFDELRTEENERTVRFTKARKKKSK